MLIQNKSSCYPEIKTHKRELCAPYRLLYAISANFWSFHIYYSEFLKAESYLLKDFWNWQRKFQYPNLSISSCESFTLKYVENVNKFENYGFFLRKSNKVLNLSLLINSLECMNSDYFYDFPYPSIKKIIKIS